MFILSYMFWRLLCLIILHLDVLIFVYGSAYRYVFAVLWAIQYFSLLNNSEWHCFLLLSVRSMPFWLEAPLVYRNHRKLFGLAPSRPPSASFSPLASARIRWFRTGRSVIPHHRIV
jgi:hypothetical protein